MTTIATIQRPTRFNEEFFRKEIWCHNHWWAGDTCLYGVNSLLEEEPVPPVPHVEEEQHSISSSLQMRRCTGRKYITMRESGAWLRSGASFVR